MDFVDYGEYAKFLHIRETFSRFPVSVFIGAKKKEAQKAERVRETAISH